MYQPNETFTPAEARPATNGALDRFHQCAKTVKAAVPIEQVAAEYTEMKLAGPNRLLGRCPSPEHEDRTASFTLFTRDQRFKCFGIGCGITGDVLDLEALCGDHSELWTAMIALSVRYGVALPERPPEWFRWQNQKAKVRDVVRHRLATTYQRRLTRIYGPLLLLGGETPKREQEELTELAEALWPECLALAKWRMDE